MPYILEKDGDRVEMINEQRMERFVRLGWSLVEAPKKKRAAKKAKPPIEEKPPADMQDLLRDLEE